MARTKTPIANGLKCSVIEEVTESFTHRQFIGGRMVYGDPARNFWRRDGGSWYGASPEGWDASKAEILKEPLTYSYMYEADYS